ncbi:hypothetical protein [Nocardioides coralli]|uniref:hypothetical protein n=1 Tax=Nocardioides coralli TaxID=2872154 RepID=UPI001CA3BC26|nr:hypothetical protein [Nocardioides coralli]QZY28006.1 hypothetical protein K6T13_10915 [Nocardioides coralli]
MSSGPRDAGGGDEVGSVGEEAAKLFGALSGWAKEQGSDLGAGLSGLAAQAAAVAQDVDEHVATGSSECRYCPVCRAVHAVRETSPEVREHLAVAAASLMQAAAGVLAAASGPGSRPDPAAGVEHIDLTDDEWPEDEA